MEYLVPATALKVSWLVTGPPPASSFPATRVRAATEEPVKTPSNVSKLLPAVETVTLPEEGAVQVHHTLLPPALLVMLGSPVSLVAPTFEPVTVAEVPLITMA